MFKPMKDKILEILEKHLPEGYAYKHIAKELSQLMNKPTVDKSIIEKQEELIEHLKVYDSLWEADEFKPWLDKKRKLEHELQQLKQI